MKTIFFSFYFLIFISGIQKKKRSYKNLDVKVIKLSDFRGVKSLEYRLPDIEFAVIFETLLYFCEILAVILIPDSTRFSINVRFSQLTKSVT